MQIFNKKIQNCLIAVTQGIAYLIEPCDELLEEPSNFFDGACLNDQYFINKEEIPSVTGIYRCEIEVSVDKTFDDYIGADEYETEFKIANVKQIVLNYENIQNIL